MSNKKGVWQVAISSSALLLILIILFLIVVLPTLQREEGFVISLKDNNIVQDEDLILFYKVSNPTEEIMQDVSLRYEIIDTSISSSRNIGSVDGGQEILGNIRLNLINLNKGQHTIGIILTYRMGNETKEKELTLGFEIF